MRELSCSVLLVHHTGVSTEAQHRARGSSAWRGALDIEVSIVPATSNTPMEIHQKKSKDAEVAVSLYAELHQVAIPGWLDEDNNQVTSAVLIQAGKPPKENKESKITGFIKLFENAWFASGCELIDGDPYISRSALKDKLINDGRKDRTVANDLNPSYDDKLIGALLLAEIITPVEHGWAVVDGVIASKMLLKR